METSIEPRDSTDIITEEQVQEAITKYIEVQKELFTLSEEAKELVIFLNQAAGNFEKKTGIVRATGITEVAKVKRRVNISYSKKPGDVENVLEHASRNGLDDCVSISYKEKGTKIGDLLKKWKKGEDIDIDNQLLQRLEEARVEKEGKPEITIEDKKK